MENQIRTRRTKIVATIGPASSSTAIIEGMLRNGMNVARLNLAHGSHADHAANIETIRAASQRLGLPVAVLIDLPGPKYRIGRLQGGEVVLARGATVTLTTRNVEGNATLLPVNLPNLPRDIRRRDTVLLDDGALQLRVVDVAGSEVRCRVVVGGLLKERRGLVVPGMPISEPFLSEILRDNIAFAVSQQPDYLALSFVSRAEDVNTVKAILREDDVDIPLVAKIERVEAVNDFDEILAASDAVMVARGDLGVEMPLEKVPLVQKDIIRRCNRAGKPVITATQMLESMANAIRPTRAEVTDVANAIFDGSDALMLSAETTIGKYPLESVRTMATIARATEKKLDYDRMLAERGDWFKPQTNEMIAYSVCRTAHSLKAAAIVALTSSGGTAARISKYRQQAPILALTPDRSIGRKLFLNWGVHAVENGPVASLDDLFASAVRVAREAELAKPGDLIVVAGGIPLGVAGGTNLLKVEKVV